MLSAHDSPKEKIGDDTIGKKDDRIKKLESELEIYKGMTESMKTTHKTQLDKLRKEFEHLDNIVIPMDLEVDITGYQDIPATLDAAVELMENRFEALGLKKTKFLAHPHTMKLKIMSIEQE